MCTHNNISKGIRGNISLAVVQIDIFTILCRKSINIILKIISAEDHNIISIIYNVIRIYMVNRVLKCFESIMEIILIQTVRGILYFIE